MRGSFFALGAGLVALGCTVDTSGSGQGLPGSAGTATGTGGSVMAAGGSSASGGSNVSTGGGAAGSGPGKACGQIWYNGESGQGDVNLAATTTWTDPKMPAQGSSMISESTTNPHGGTSSLQVDLNWATGYYGGAFGINFVNYDMARAYDVHGAADLEFWIRTETGNNTHVVVWLKDTHDPNGSNRVEITSSSPVTPQWRKISIPLTQFTGVDLSAIWEIDADTHSDPFGVAGGVKFFVDDGAFTTPGCL